MEIWKDIDGYEGLYQVSNLGNVKSLMFGPKNRPYLQNHPKLLKLAKSSTGYTHVQLYKDGKSSTKLVHKLVANAFIPNPLSKPEVNHLDANRANNVVENLEWVTHSENLLYAIKIGNRKPSRRSSHMSIAKSKALPCKKSVPVRNNKKQVLQYTPDGIFVKKWNSIAEIEEFYKCNRTGITNCLSGKNKTSINYRWIEYKQNDEILLKIPPIEYGRKNQSSLFLYHCSGHKGRSVIQYSLEGTRIRTWDNCIEAAKELNVDKQNIYTCANGKYRKAYGYVWKWKDEVDN